MSEKRVRRCYGEEEIETGLAETALCAGNTRLASRRLAERGIEIPRGTLKSWIDTIHPQRYHLLRMGKVKEVQARIAQDLEDQVGALSEIGLLTIERFRDQLTNLRASEAASAIRDIAQAQKTAVEKSQSLRGDPTQIVVHRPDADELWKQLRRIAPHAFIDSTAEEEEREPNLGVASTRAPLAGHIDGIQSADLDGRDPRAVGLRQHRAVLPNALAREAD